MTPLRLSNFVLACGWLATGVGAYDRMLHFGASTGSGSAFPLVPTAGGAPTDADGSPTDASAGGFCPGEASYFVAARQGGGACEEEGGTPVLTRTECVIAQASQVEGVIQTPYLMTDPSHPGGTPHSSLIAGQDGTAYDPILTDHGPCTLAGSSATRVYENPGCQCDSDWECGVAFPDTCDPDCQTAGSCSSFATDGCQYCTCMQAHTGDEAGSWGLLSGCVLMASGKGIGGVQQHCTGPNDCTFIGSSTGYSGCSHYNFVLDVQDGGYGAQDARDPGLDGVEGSSITGPNGPSDWGSSTGWQVCRVVGA